MTRWLVLALAALVVLAVGYFALNWFRGPLVTVVAQPVARETIVAYIDERGMTRVPERYEISMPFDGRIERLELQEGDRVSAGQVVARLTPQDVELQVAAAEAVLRRLEASLAENADVTLEMTAKQQTELLAQAVKAMADAAQFQHAATSAWSRYWTAYVERVLPLAARYAETQEELERATANRESFAAELQQRELNSQSQSLLYQAMQLTPQLILDYLQRKKLQGEVIAKQLQEAKVAMDEALLQNQRATMTSPIDGVVLERPLFSEQYQRAGTVLLTIGQLQQMEVQADVLTQEAASVKVGDRAEIYGPALGLAPGKGVRGTVRRISPDAFTKVSSLGVEEQRATIVMSIENPQELLKQRPGLGVGFRVRVRIFTSQKPDAVTIARPALFRAAAGQWSVFVVRGGRAVMQAVELGILNDERAEVLRGLDPGEQVILAPESNLVQGTRVRLSQP